VKVDLLYSKHQARGNNNYGQKWILALFQDCHQEIRSMIKMALLTVIRRHNICRATKEE
jgi:hypothetical protein